jgi:hypothetical protein
MEESTMSLFIITVTICVVMSLAALLDKPIKKFLAK